MTKRLYSLVIKAYLGPLVVTFFIAMMVLLMQFLWKYIDELVGKGLDLFVIGEFLLYASARLVQMALPLSVLLSSIMTFGNLGEHNELLAIKSAGISLQKVMAPLIGFIIIISVSAFLFANHVIPYTNMKLSTLMRDINRKRPEINLKEGAFNDDIKDYIIKIGKKNQKNNHLYDVVIYNHSQGNRNNNVTTADSAKMQLTKDEQFMIITLWHGRGYQEAGSKPDQKKDEFYPQRRDVFDKKVVILKMEGFELQRSDEEIYRKHYRMMNNNQLDSAITYLYEQQDAYVADITKQRWRNYFKRNKKRYLSKSETDTPVEELTCPLNLDSIFEEFDNSSQMRTMDNALRKAREVKASLDNLEENTYKQSKNIRKHEIEWHRKYTLAFACFIFFFVGAPLGAIIRKGGLGLPVIVSTLFFVFYYVISLISEKLAREVILPTYQSMWMSSIIILPLGVFLTYKATTDSVMMNSEFYIRGLIRFFKSPFSVFKKKKDREDQQI